MPRKNSVVIEANAGRGYRRSFPPHEPAIRRRHAVGIRGRFIRQARRQEGALGRMAAPTPGRQRHAARRIRCDGRNARSAALVQTTAFSDRARQVNSP
jgi:hypothetical protein